MRLRTLLYMSERVSQIRARLAFATPGPWRTTDQVGVWAMVHGPHNVEVAHALTYMSHNNGPLIANAPSDLAWLLDELERVKVSAVDLQLQNRCSRCGCEVCSD